MNKFKFILKRIPFIKEIYMFVYKFLYVKNPLMWKYKFDGIYTNSNLSFLADNLFQECYAEGVRFAKTDYRFFFRIHQALWCVENIKGLDGDLIELGTGKGFTFASIACMLTKLEIKKNIYLFDTFLPYKTDVKTGRQDKEGIISNFYAENYESVKRSFEKYPFVDVIQGFCPDVLIDVVPKKCRNITFLHIDLNYYLAEIQSLEYLWPYLVEGSFILLDDYANFGREKQNQEYKTFFSNKHLPILTLASGQGLVIKTTQQV